MLPWATENAVRPAGRHLPTPGLR